MKRPNWHEVMKGCGGAAADDNDLIVVTRGTLKLSQSALRAQNEREAYHNYMAAEWEIKRTLAANI